MLPLVYQSYLDSGSGLQKVITGSHAKSSEDIRCFASSIQHLRVRNPTNNAWAGSIMYSHDGGKTQLFLQCSSCTGATSTETIVVDGNGDASDQAATTCLHGEMCALEVPAEALLLEEWSETDAEWNTTDGLECLSGSQEEAFENCSQQLPEETPFREEMVEACALDVCVGGPELIEHTAAIAEQSNEVVKKELASVDRSVDAPLVLCHTCVPGDNCFKDVEWAMKVGIPEKRYEGKGWAPAVDESSCFEEVQDALRVWQSLPHFEMGAMSDRAVPRACGSSSGPHLLHDLMYCR